MIIIQHGEAKAVIQDIDEYERVQEALSLLKTDRICLFQLGGKPGTEHIPFELEGFSDMLFRQLVFKNNRIIYQAIGHVVIIQGIIDGCRNINKVLRQRILI